MLNKCFRSLATSALNKEHPSRNEAGSNWSRTTEGIHPQPLREFIHNHWGKSSTTTEGIHPQPLMKFIHKNWGNSSTAENSPAITKREQILELYSKGKSIIFLMIFVLRKEIFLGFFSESCSPHFWQTPEFYCYCSLLIRFLYSKAKGLNEMTS